MERAAPGGAAQTRRPETMSPGGYRLDDRLTLIWKFGRQNGARKAD